jgi:hypothetical protein
MNTDRRAILSLVATGRITPLEAERLLALWPDGEDAMARLALCLGFVWLVLSHAGELFKGLEHTLVAHAPATHHALASAAHWFGGLL